MYWLVSPTSCSLTHIILLLSFSFMKPLQKIEHRSSILKAKNEHAFLQDKKRLMRSSYSLPRKNVHKKVWFRKFGCNEHRSSNQKNPKKSWNSNNKNYGVLWKKIIVREVHVSEIPKFTCTTYRREIIKWRKGPPRPF